MVKTRSKNSSSDETRTASGSIATDPADAFTERAYGLVAIVVLSAGAANWIYLRTSR